jgi:hypothetical protein
MSSGGVVRKIVWQLGLKTDRVDEQIKQIEAGVNRVSGAFAKVQSFANGALVAMGAFYGTLALVGTSSAKFGEEMQRISDGLGVNVEALQEYKAAFDVLGGSTDDLTDTLTTLTDRATAALEGSSTYAKEFNRIGIAVKELKGLKPEEIFELYLERAAKTNDVNKVTTASVRLLGDDLGRRLMPALVNAQGEMGNLRKAARDLGLVLEADLIKRLKDAQIQFRQAEFISRGFVRRLGAEIVPALSKYAETFSSLAVEHARTIGGLSFLLGDKLFAEAKKVTEAMRDVFGGVDQDTTYSVANGLERVARSLRLVAVGAGIVGAALAAAWLFSGIGPAVIAVALALGLVVGVLDSLYVRSKGGISIISQLETRFPSLGESADKLILSFNALLKELDGIGKEFRGLQRELTESDDNANWFEVTLNVVIGTVIVLLRVLTALAFLVAAVTREMVGIGRQIAKSIRSAREEFQEFFDSLDAKGQKFLNTLLKIADAALAMAEINPFTALPANVAAGLAGRDISPTGKLDRIGAGLSALNPFSSASNAAAESFGTTGGVSRAAGGASSTNVQVDQRIGDVTVQIVQSSGNAEQDGRDAVRGLTEQMRDATDVLGGAA